MIVFFYDVVVYFMLFYVQIDDERTVFDQLGSSYCILQFVFLLFCIFDLLFQVQLISNIIYMYVYMQYYMYNIYDGELLKFYNYIYGYGYL